MGFHKEVAFSCGTLPFTFLPAAIWHLQTSGGAGGGCRIFCLDGGSDIGHILEKTVIAGC